jgi:hypothetical protein
MKITVTIPVRLEVEPEILRGALLGELETRLAGELRAIWQRTQAELRADGFAGVPDLGRTAFEWSGPGRRALPEPERRQVERRLRRVIDTVAAAKLPAESVRLWVVHPPRLFTARFDRFMDFVRPWWNRAYLHEVEGLVGEHFTDNVRAMAWLVDITGDVAVRDVLSGLIAVKAQAGVGGGLHLLFRSRGNSRKLHALDPGALSGFPALASDEEVFPPGERLSEAQLGAGTRLVFAAVKNPPPSTRPLLDFSPPFEVRALFRDMVYRTFLEQDTVTTALGPVDLTAVAELYPDWTVRVEVLPFKVQRPIHSDVLLRLAGERARQGSAGDVRFGRAVSLPAGDWLPNSSLSSATLRSVDVLPAEVTERLDTTTPAPSRAALAEGAPEWQAEDRGVFVWPELDDLRERTYVAQHLDDLRGEARELSRVLDISDGFWSAPRLDALEQFMAGWKVERSKLQMEVIFAELDRLGAFEQLFTVLYDHYALWGWMRVAAIGNVTGTSFEQRTVVQRLVTKMNQIRIDIRSQITWDPVTNELVFVHSGARVKAAGENNPNPNAGVIGEVESYFSQRSVVSRPSEQTMKRLADPTRRHVGRLIVAMMCKGGETRTKEQLIQEAIQAAAKELNLTEKDFDRVRVRLSNRVIRIERVPEHGLDAVYVTIRPVLKYGDGDWEDAGEPETISLAQLDSELVSIQVDHEVAALTAFLLIEAVLVGGGYIIITGGWLGLAELVIAISIREILYVWHTSEADRDLEGYLTNALFGVLDVLGFRLGAAASARLAGAAITSRVAGNTVRAWLLNAGRFIVPATALGGTSVVEKFVDDFFHLSSCRRWSSPWEYFEEFGSGFAIGLAFEYVLIPGLSIAARAAIRRVTSEGKATVEEAAAELLKHLAPEDIEKYGEEGAKQLEQALGNVAKGDNVGLAARFMQALRQHIKEIVEHARTVPEAKGFFNRFRAEWTSRAAKELFEGAKVATNGSIQLGSHAMATLDVLARSTTRAEMGRIVEALYTGTSTRAFLDSSPKIGVQLLTRVFRESPKELEVMLGQMAKLPADDAASMLTALIRIPRLSSTELGLFARLAETHPAELVAFLKVAEVGELTSFFRLFEPPAQIERDAISELLHLGGSRPGAFHDVRALLKPRLSAGERITAATVRDAVAETERAAEEEALRVKQRLARKDVTPHQASASIDKDARFGRRKEELPKLTDDPNRVAQDLESARIERERYEIMKNGDPARGGERRPLAFETWDEYDEFKRDFGRLVRELGGGKEIEAQGQVIGSSTSFYSGNPDKPLGHYYDRKGPGFGDVDVDLFSPDLVKDMFDKGVPTLNEKVLVGGERTIFKNEGGGKLGFHDVFPKVSEFIETWSERLGREVDVKLRIDLTLPPKPKTGPIEFFRKETR